MWFMELVLKTSDAVGDVYKRHVRSYKARSNKGKSLFFLVVLFVGYIFGILHKIFYSLDFVLILYCLNAAMVGTDICFYFRNRRLEREEKRRNN